MRGRSWRDRRASEDRSLTPLLPFRTNPLWLSYHILMRKKTGRNDSCWCGSGRKYKKCHLLRASEKPLPLSAITREMRQVFDATEICLHPLASPTTCGKIVAAHTIQRAGALKHLVDATKHVRTFYPIQSDEQGQPIVRKRGWKEASTFNGFCTHHDSVAFAPLETVPFTGTPEQCFLLGYRALCHEVYQKMATTRVHPLQRELVDKGQPVEEQRLIQHHLAVTRMGQERGLQNAREKKARMDQDFLSRDFRNWHYYIVRFMGEICVASTGTPTPTYDFAGRQLQVLHDPATAIQYLSLSVVPIQDGGAIVFSWHAADKACSRFITSLDKVSKKLLPMILVQLMFAYIENTFFSDAWWSSLTDAQRAHIKLLASMDNPYYGLVPYRQDILVPWQVTVVERL